MTEVWKSIPGFDGYDVGDHGRVRSYRNGRWGLRKNPTLLKCSGAEYPRVTLSRGGRKHYIRVHKLVMLAFIGPPPDGMQVCHKNSNGLDNRLENLRYDTRIGNERDKCPFTDGQIVKMRERRAAGEKMAALAREHNVSYTHMWNICTGRTLTLVGGPITPSKPRSKYTYIRRNFTDEQIIDIRQRRQHGETLRSIAGDYKVSIAHISKIDRGESYKNVPTPRRGVSKMRILTFRELWQSRDPDLAAAQKAKCDARWTVRGELEPRRRTRKRNRQR